MSSASIFLGAFVVYSLFLLWLGWVSVRKHAMTANQYFQAGKSTGMFVFLFGTLSSIFSSWMFMGNPALFAAHGIAGGAWLIQVPIIALGIYYFWNRQYLLCSKYGFNTAGDILGDFYGSKVVQLLVALMACLYCIPYIVVQMKGAGALVHTLSDGYLSTDWGIYIIAAVTIIYLVVGGMKGTAWTSALQGFLLLLGFYGMAIFIFKEAGFFGIWENLAGRPGYLTMPGPQGGWNWPYTLSFAAVTALGIAVSPTYTLWISTCGKGFFKLSRASSWWTWTLVCGFTYMVTMFIVGLGGFTLLPNIQPFDALVPTIMRDYFPIALYCVVGVAAISAAQSTAATSLQAATTSIVKDVIIRVFDYHPADRQILNIGRITNVLLLIISMIAANQFSAMIAILGSVGVSFGAMLIPAWIGAMFWPRLSKAGVSAGIICGSVTLIVLYATGSPLNKIMHFGFWGLLVNAGVSVGVSLFTELPPMEKVRRFHGYLKSCMLPQKQKTSTEAAPAPAPAATSVAMEKA